MFLRLIDLNITYLFPKDKTYASNSWTKQTWRAVVPPELTPYPLSHPHSILIWDPEQEEPQELRDAVRQKPKIDTKVKLAENNKSVVQAETNWIAEDPNLDHTTVTPLPSRNPSLSLLLPLPKNCFIGVIPNCKTISVHSGIRTLSTATVVNTLNLEGKPSQLDWSSITYLVVWYQSNFWTLFTSVSILVKLWKQ